MWQWQIGIFGLFLAWVTFLKFVNKLMNVGIYVLMLGKIIWTFVKVAASIGIPLILAFSWPFYMVLHDFDASVSCMLFSANPV